MVSAEIALGIYAYIWARFQYSLFCSAECCIQKPSLSPTLHHIYEEPILGRHYRPCSKTPPPQHLKAPSAQLIFLLSSASLFYSPHIPRAVLSKLVPVPRLFVSRGICTKRDCWQLRLLYLHWRQFRQSDLGTYCYCVIRPWRPGLCTTHFHHPFHPTISPCNCYFTSPGQWRTFGRLDKIWKHQIYIKTLLKEIVPVTNALYLLISGECRRQGASHSLFPGKLVRLSYSKSCRGVGWQRQRTAS